MKPLRLPVLFALATVLTVPVALAQSGTLDPSFGTGGVATTALPTDIYDLAEQADGKIVVVGATATHDEWAIARLWPNGDLDTDFGTNGVVTMFANSPNHATDVVVDGSDRILVTGWVTYPGEGGFFTVVRLLPDGALDPAFGNGGIAQVQIGNGGVSTSIALQPDGKIVLGGFAYAKRSHAFALARFKDDGTLDTDGFGPTGRKKITYTGYVLHDIDSRKNDQTSDGTIALQPDGKILLGGYTGYSTMNESWTLARYNTDGTVDSSFGDDGVVIQSFAGLDYVQLWGLAIDDARARIYVSGRGWWLNGEFDVLVAAYDFDGDLDGSFGTGGMTMTGYPGEDDGFGCVVQPDGKIVVCGCVVSATHVVEATAFRFLTNGDLDADFGPYFNGLAEVTSTTGYALARSILLDAGGGLLLGGSDGAGGLLVRYQ